MRFVIIALALYMKFLALLSCQCCPLLPCPLCSPLPLLSRLRNNPQNHLQNSDACVANEGCLPLLPSASLPLPRSSCGRVAELGSSMARLTASSNPNECSSVLFSESRAFSPWLVPRLAIDFVQKSFLKKVVRGKEMV